MKNIVKILAVTLAILLCIHSFTIQPYQTRDGPLIDFSTELEEHFFKISLHTICLKFTLTLRLTIIEKIKEIFEIFDAIRSIETNK